MAEMCCQFGSDSGINPRPCNWPVAPGSVLHVFNECYSRRDGHRFQRGRDSVLNQLVITLSLSSPATFFLFTFSVFLFFFQTRVAQTLTAIEIHYESRISRRQRTLGTIICNS